jgi:uncharacterized protein YggT (Ycf19 family)
VASGSQAIRTTLTITMNVLIAVAVVMAARMVVEFFGVLATQPWGEALIALTDPLVVPIAEPIKTPYGGVFSLGAAATITLLVVAEWVLSIVRTRA